MLRLRRQFYGTRLELPLGLPIQKQASPGNGFLPQTISFIYLARTRECLGDP